MRIFCAVLKEYKDKSAGSSRVWLVETIYLNHQVKLISKDKLVDSVFVGIVAFLFFLLIK